VSSAKALLAVLVASVCVELVQGLSWTDGRQANVDDVLLNVVGAAITLAVLRVLRGRPRSTPG
jgi:glycopeptide antibiotics resistance protein